MDTRCPVHVQVFVFVRVCLSGAFVSTCLDKKLFLDESLHVCVGKYACECLSVMCFTSVTLPRWFASVSERTVL